MTDNEKRAHDFAIAIAIDIRSIKMKPIEAGAPAEPFDYFAEYLKAYELTLNAFNEKFPAGK